MKNKKYLFLLALIAIGVCGCGDSNSDPHYQSGDLLKVISVEMSGEYSECTIIKYHDYEIVVDSGKSQDTSHIKSVLANYCTDNTIDLMVMTHPHGDHIGGFNNGAFDSYNVTNLVDFGYTYNPSGTGDEISSQSIYGSYSNKRDYFINKGTKYYPITTALNSFNNIQIDKDNNLALTWLKNDYYVAQNVVFPNSDVPSDNPNVTSVSFNLSYKYYNVVMCGDADSTYAEPSIVKNHKDLFTPTWKKTFVKANHHGSSSSLGSTFLSWVHPQAMFISAAMVSSVRAPNEVTLGTGGQAHPDKTTISRIKNYLKDKGNQLYWNAINGDLLMSSNGVSDFNFAGSGRSFDYLKKGTTEIASIADEKNVSFFDSEFYKYYTK